MLRRMLVFGITILLTLSPVITSAAASPNITSSPNLRLLQSNSSAVILELSSPDSTQMVANLTSGITPLPELPGFQSTKDAGKPQLPVSSTLVGVPPDASIELRLLADDDQILPGVYRVPPAPTPAMIQGNSLDESLQLTSTADHVQSWDYSPDPKIYSQDANFPPAPVRISPDAWVRDQRVVRVDFYPYQYNPQRGSLTWHKLLRAELIFHAGVNPTRVLASLAASPDQPDPFGDVLKPALINYDTARLWRGRAPVLSADQPLVDIPTTSTTRYKIIVDHDGLYQLTRSDLVAAGIDFTQVNPQNFRLTSQGQPVAINIINATDGSFSNLTFYGQRFYGDRLAARYAAEADNWITLTQQLTDGTYAPWRPTIQPISLEKYTNKNVYWLEVDNPGPRIASVNGDPTGSPAATPDHFIQTVHAEQSNFRWLPAYTFIDQEEWFWDHISDFSMHTYTTSLNALYTQPYSATVRAEVVSTGSNSIPNPNHQAEFFINNRPIANVGWNGISRYHLEMNVPQPYLVEGNNSLGFQAVSDLYGKANYYFDWFEISYARQYKALNDSLTFTGDISGTWKYQVSGFASPDISVFDITQPLTPTQIVSSTVTGSAPPYTLTFVATHPAGEKFIASGSSALQAPLSVQAYTDHLAGDTQGAQYVLIAPPELLAATQSLAVYRQAKRLSTKVVNLNDIYNEFNDGITHPFAIKQFLKYVYTHWSIPPVYVVLVGDGNWNLQGYNPGNYGSAPNYMPPNLAWVDPWMGEVDSSNLLANIVGNDPIPDLFISRIPVRSQADLYEVLSKILTYESAPVQPWQRNLLFVADQADPAGDFAYSSDVLISSTIPEGFNTDRIYLDNYINTGQCLPVPGNDCPAVTHAITETLSITGSLFLTYNGHGAVQKWFMSSLFVTNTVITINNGAMLPVVFSLDCLDGYWIHPLTQPSLAEAFLTAPNRGAVSTFSPTGLGLSDAHDTLAYGFFSSFFKNGNWQLGPATLAAKLAMYASGSNYDLISTYTLFGDPALKVKNPYSYGQFLPVLIR